MLGFAPIPGISPRSSPVAGQGPFPRPALPGVLGRTDPSAICPGRRWPSRVRRRPAGCRPWSPGQTSLVAHRFSAMRAATLTPVGSAGAYLARLPVDGGLPRSAGGSAPTSDTFEACSVFARAAARMARWPPTGAVSRSASDHSSPPDPLRVLPAGARVAGWDLHPRNQCTFARHTAERGRAFSPDNSWGRDSRRRNPSRSKSWLDSIESALHPPIGYRQGLNERLG